MSDTGYVYDQAWEQERERLAGIEALWDAGTQTILARYVSPGSRVLEAGAGGGSVVSWLASQVGPSGRVLAIDLDTRFVEPLASDVVEVRQANLVTDELPTGEYDVVHSRMVLEHITERADVLRRLAAALRPGGVMVLEDYDWSSFGFEATDEAPTRVTEAILALMSAAGFEREYGRRLVSALAEAGLSEVTGEGRSLVIDGSHPGFAFFSLSFEQLAPAAIDAGLMRAEDADAVGARLRTGTERIITPTLMAAVGRKP
ncbi:MAG TPA: methyltransferase domain-containing protein [Mycobacteriales bacterium]|nr:methyltransferase domain-containing protein [Mycobacteriales bacterium]